MSLLDAIVDQSRRRTAERRARRPIEDVQRAAADAPPARSLYAALSPGFGVIAEHKRRSPSAGAMRAENVAECVAAYEATPWVTALSVLTDEDHFGGSMEDLTAIRARTTKPILRKDFIVEPYQVVEARAAGADAILLMCTLHVGERARMQDLYDLARSLGLDVLVEVVGMSERPEEELVALVPEGAGIWGMNARRSLGGRAGIKTGVSRLLFQVTGRDTLTDTRRHQDLRRLVPPGPLAVAESGITTAVELAEVRAAGYDAALVGTAFLKGPKSVADVVRELGMAFGGE